MSTYDGPGSYLKLVPHPCECFAQPLRLTNEAALWADNLPPDCA